MRSTRTLATLLVLGLLLGGTVLPPWGAQARSPDDASPNLTATLDLSWWTVDGGGQTFSTGGDFQLGATIAQPDAGALRGGDFILAGGFWPSVTAWEVAYSTYLPVVLRH